MAVLQCRGNVLRQLHQQAVLGPQAQRVQLVVQAAVRQLLVSGSRVQQHIGRWAKAEGVSRVPERLESCFQLHPQPLPPHLHHSQRLLQACRQHADDAWVLPHSRHDLHLPAARKSWKERKVTFMMIQVCRCCMHKSATSLLSLACKPLSVDYNKGTVLAKALGSALDGWANFTATRWPRHSAAYTQAAAPAPSSLPSFTCSCVVAGWPAAWRERIYGGSIARSGSSK